jgi:hypothetical protein
VAIARGLADGLAHVHTHFGPHGGLRSTNVLLKGDGLVCVADYGVHVLQSPPAHLSQMEVFGAHVRHTAESSWIPPHPRFG